MLSNSDKTYSSLEAVMQPTRRPDSEKQVVPDDGKQCVVNSEATEAESNRWYVGNQTIRHHQRWRKKWILCIGAFTLIIILAAVLGGLFGSRSNQSPKASPSSLSSSSARATASPAASTTATTQSSPNTSSDTSTQRKIAAFSFPWGTNNNTRMYFQDNERQILEAGNPEANSTWGFRALGVSGKNRTVLAAAVSDLAFSDEAFSEVTGAPLDRRIHADILQGISVIYLDAEDHLCDVNYVYPTETWSPGSLSDRGYTALANSSLAILYNQCASCANSTIIAFQDQDGHIQIGNLTSSGWTLTQLGTGMDPIMGTGLALEALRGYHEGWPLQINLHYQKSNLSLCQASWIPNNPSSDNGSLMIILSVMLTLMLEQPMAGHSTKEYTTPLRWALLSPRLLRLPTPQPASQASLKYCIFLPMVLDTTPGRQRWVIGVREMPNLRR